MENHQHRDAGSTALIASVVGDYMSVANVGDSQVVFYRSKKSFVILRDHKPNQNNEWMRIDDDGGFFIWAGIK